MNTLFPLSSLSGHSDSFSLFLKVVFQSNIFSVSTEQNRTKLESSIPIEWSRVGISCIKDLFIDNTFALFQQISNRFSLPKNHFFRYLQVCSFITNTYREFPLLTDETPLDMFFKPPQRFTGIIFIVYKPNYSLRSHSLDSVKNTWSNELGIFISDQV